MMQAQNRPLRLLGFCVATLLLTAATARAQDYEIKLSRPAKVGDTYQMTVTCEDEREMVVKFTGKPPQTQKDKTTVKLVGDVKVLEVATRGEELKILCTVIECTAASQNGQAAPVVPPGTKVTVFNIGPECRLLDQENKPFALPVENLLKLVLQTEDPDAPGDDETFGPDGRKKVGESWPANAEKLRAGAARQKMTIAKDGVSGSTKLVELKKVNGRECLVLEGKVNAKLELGGSLPGLPPALTLKSGTVDVVMGKTIPIDSSAPSLAVTQKLNTEMLMGGNAPDGSGPVELAMKSRRHVERNRAFK